MTALSTIDPGRIAGRWVWKKFNRTVRLGVAVLRSDDQQHRVAMGAALIAFGLMKGRSGPKLIYKTSIDVGEGMTIRVMQGRRPIADTAPLR